MHRSPSMRGGAGPARPTDILGLGRPLPSGDDPRGERFGSHREQKSHHSIRDLDTTVTLSPSGMGTYYRTPRSRADTMSRGKLHRISSNYHQTTSSEEAQARRQKSLRGLHDTDFAAPAKISAAHA